MKVKQAALGFIFATILIDSIGFGLVIPILPQLIGELTGEPANEASSTASFLLFGYAFMQFFFAPILGGLSDKIGRRPVLLLALLGLAVDYLLQALSPTIYLLFIGRILAGICGSTYSTASAYIADISTTEKKAQNFGMIGVAFGLGFIIGPAIGGVIGGSWGPRMPFYVAAVLTLINFVYGFFILPESLPSENRRKFEWSKANPVNSIKSITSYPGLLGLFVALFVIYMAGYAVQSNWSFYVAYKFGWGASMIGYSLSFVGILIAGVQGGLIRIINPKLGNKRSIILGYGMSVVGLVLFGVAHRDWVMFAALIPYALSGLATPAMQSVMSNEVPVNRQGELQGTLGSIMSITSILGPLIMNNLFAWATNPDTSVHFPGISFELGAILTLAGLIIAMATLNKLEQR